MTGKTLHRVEALFYTPEQVVFLRVLLLPLAGITGDDCPRLAASTTAKNRL